MYSWLSHALLNANCSNVYKISNKEQIGAYYIPRIRTWASLTWKCVCICEYILLRLLLTNTAYTVTKWNAKIVYIYAQENNDFLLDIVVPLAKIVQ